MARPISRVVWIRDSMISRRVRLVVAAVDAAAGKIDDDIGAVQFTAVPLRRAPRRRLRLPGENSHRVSFVVEVFRQGLPRLDRRLQE